MGFGDVPVIDVSKSTKKTRDESFITLKYSLPGNSKEQNMVSGIFWDTDLGFPFNICWNRFQNPLVFQNLKKIREHTFQKILSEIKILLLYFSTTLKGLLSFYATPKIPASKNNLSFSLLEIL